METNINVKTKIGPNKDVEGVADATTCEVVASAGIGDVVEEDSDTNNSSLSFP